MFGLQWQQNSTVILKLLFPSFLFLSFFSFYSFLSLFFLGLSFSYFPSFAFLLPPFLTFLLFYFNTLHPSLPSFFLISLSAPIKNFLLPSDQSLCLSSCLILLFILCSLSASLFPPRRASSFFSLRLVFFLSFLFFLLLLFLFYIVSCIHSSVSILLSSYFIITLLLNTFCIYLCHFFLKFLLFRKNKKSHIFFLLTVSFFIFDVIICLRSIFYWSNKSFIINLNYLDFLSLAVLLKSMVFAPPFTFLLQLNRTKQNMTYYIK